MRASLRAAVAPAVELFTVAELAATLKLRPKTVRAMAAHGVLSYHRLNGKELRFTRGDLEQLLAATRVEARKGSGKL
jgi:excisionase family DNA binding protein